MYISQILTKAKREIEFWWFYKNFYKNFVFYTSEDKKELEELYKIRYQVYCEEYRYIDKSKTKNGLEFDEWDPRSLHFIIRDLDKEICATVRLILNSEQKFPIFKHFKLDVNINHYNLNKVAEISRFIVTSKYRRHHLMFVLIKGLYLYVKSTGIENIFSVLDDKLFPLLISLGVPFRKIGPPSLYQGFTYPCVLNCKEFEIQLSRSNKRLYHYLTEGMISYDNIKQKYSLS